MAWVEVLDPVTEEVHIEVVKERAENVIKKNPVAEDVNHIEKPPIFTAKEKDASSEKETEVQDTTDMGGKSSHQEPVTAGDQEMLDGGNGLDKWHTVQEKKYIPRSVVKTQNPGPSESSNMDSNIVIPIYSALQKSFPLGNSKRAKRSRGKRPSSR